MKSIILEVTDAEQVYRNLFCIMFLSTVVLTGLLGCDETEDEEDDTDDDDHEDDDDDDAPSTYILTSGYGNSYRIINGETFVEYDAATPTYDPTFQGGPDNAIFVSNGSRMVSVFMALTGAEKGDTTFDQMYYADAMTAENVVYIDTGVDKPGTGDMVPAGDKGLMYVGVEDGTDATLFTLNTTTMSSSILKSGDFSKNIGGDLCEPWGGFESPSYAPNGMYFAVGWHCKDKNGPDIPEYTTVLAFNFEDEDCGDPLFEVDQSRTIEDTCFTYDSSAVIFSYGLPNVTKKSTQSRSTDRENCRTCRQIFLVAISTSSVAIRYPGRSFLTILKSTRTSIC